MVRRRKNGGHVVPQQTRYTINKMRSLISHVIVFALLLMSLEGATGSLIEGVPHGGDNGSHQIEFGHGLVDHDRNVPDSELDDDHCKHCCHGHCFTGLPISAQITVPDGSRDRISVNKWRISNFAQAPPTPPPNA